MSRTLIGVGDPMAVKRFSAFLIVESIKKSYWLQKFMGVYQEDGENKPITLINDLEKAAGDTVTYDLIMRLRGQGVEGDNTLKGKEEKLVPYTDTLLIDQFRHGVDTGGKMTKKRTVHNLRQVARKGLRQYFAEWYDCNITCYLSGARGIDTDNILPLTWTGRAGNALNAPDSDHIRYAAGKAKATLTAADKMTLDEIDWLVAHVETLYPPIQPIMVDGKPHYVLLMHSWQARDLRTNTSTGQWLDIQKAAGVRGKENPIFNGMLGVYNDVILHKHPRVVRFNDYGGASVQAARALFFGAQAGAIAFGNTGQGYRFDWHEESEDRGNVLIVDGGVIVGVKKCRFNSKDFGVVALDTACAK